MTDEAFGAMERPWLAQYETGVPPILSYPDVPLHRLLSDSAGRFPDRTAIAFYGRRIPYRELDELTDRLPDGRPADAELGREPVLAQ